MKKTIDKFMQKYFPSESVTGGKLDEHRINLATACLLIEVMRSDQTTSEIEIETIRGILASSLGLNENEVNDLVSLAEQQADKLTSYHPFTSLINKSFNMSEKVNLMTNMWQVALSDKHLDKYEEHLIRKVAGLIYIPRDQVVASKRLACEKLGLSPDKSYR